MSRKMKALLYASATATLLLAWRDVSADFVGVYCSSPATGACTAGTVCPSDPNCTINGGAAGWSVCVTSPWYCFTSNSGCLGTTGGLRNCFCPPSAFSQSGC